jgi:succinate dehydrogenase / fumarate reductase iron-sulfur subunit
MGYELRMRVWRGDRGGGALGDYQVDVEEGEVVLDAIHRLQATQAGDLAVRWNCKAGKCGSCSAEINGRPRLMCMTRLSDFEPTETITVTPMRTFPVIRDLVTDVSFNYEKAKQLPSFAPAPPDHDGKRRMKQADVERGQEFRKCIECFLCQDVCHVVRDHDENKDAFAGPRFFLRYAELDMHPLDTNDRRKLAQEAAGLGMCNITKCCTEVCPEGIKITDNAIIPMKERVVDRKYDPVVWLGSKIARRDHRREVGPRRAKPSPSPGRAPAPTPGRSPVGTGRPGAAPARSSRELLSHEAVEHALADELSGWSRDEAITRTFVAASYAQGVRLVQQVAEVADRLDHHPDVDIRWTRVTFRLSTHSAGGVTEMDLRLAREIDRLIATNR